MREESVFEAELATIATITLEQRTPLTFSKIAREASS